jgi:hypothetical protein
VIIINPFGDIILDILLILKFNLNGNIEEHYTAYIINLGLQRNGKCISILTKLAEEKAKTHYHNLPGCIRISRKQHSPYYFFPLSDDKELQN